MSDKIININTLKYYNDKINQTKQDVLISGQNIKTLNGESIIGEGDIKLENSIVQLTYNELVSLRDNSQLILGQQYRITDYNCTTTQSGTKSAGHIFDIIVIADSESVLNEEARAIQHEGDTYFANCDLNVWKLWYSLDNDTNRFAWADSTNGKGVIYRMIDEFGNDVPYDFKNIQFYRQWDSSESLWSTISSGNIGIPCYTFSSKGDSSTTSFTDMSLLASNKVYSNIIKYYISSNKQKLNNNCFFGNSCYSNSFGNGCSDNTFGRGCNYNSLGNDCWSNSFRNGCGDNTFGNSCGLNFFGSYFYNNSFGNYCYNNIFGNECSFNSFGNDCSYIKFASDSSVSTKYNCYQDNHFGDGCRYIVFTGAETASESNQVQNYNFSQGLRGTSDNYLTIEGKRNRSYETKVAMNSSGTLKIYCEADLVSNIEETVASKSYVDEAIASAITTTLNTEV